MVSDIYLVLCKAENVWEDTHMSTYSVIYNTNPYQKARPEHKNQKKARIRAAKKKQALKRQIFGIAFMFLTILATVLVSTSCLKGNQVKASSVHEENVYYKINSGRRG